MSNGGTVANTRILTSRQRWLSRRHRRVERGRVSFSLEPESCNTVGTLITVVDIRWSWRSIRAGSAVGVHWARNTPSSHHGRVDTADWSRRRWEASQGLTGNHGWEVMVDWAVHVEAPGEGLGAQGRRHLCGPVLVRVTGVKSIIEWRLHKAVKLRAKARLKRLHIPFSLPPLGSTILKPHLKVLKKKSNITFRFRGVFTKTKTCYILLFLLLHRHPHRHYHHHHHHHVKCR